MIVKDRVLLGSRMFHGELGARVLGLGGGARRRIVKDCVALGSRMFHGASVVPPAPTVRSTQRSCQGTD